MSPLDKMINNYYYQGKLDILLFLRNEIKNNKLNESEIKALISKEFKKNSNLIIK